MLAAEIRFSMDGQGRFLDNIFIERLWRSLKYEAVYLHELRDGLDAERIIVTPHPLLHKYRDTTWENGYNESFNGKLRDELLNGEVFYSLAQAAVLVEQWRREYNTVRPHSACGGFPPAPEAIKPSPWFLRMPVLHGPPRLLGLTIGCGTALGGRSLC